MYRIQAIILYRQIIRDSQVRTVLFSEEYGKITTWEKGKICGDIGSIVEVLIERKSGQNILKKMDVNHTLCLDNWRYEEVYEYLCLLHILYETLPEGSEYRSLYRSMCEFIRSINTQVGKVSFLSLMQCKVLKSLGYLSPNHLAGEESLLSLYSRIHIISMKSMFSDISLSVAHYGLIKKTILEARHTYSFRS